MSSSSFIKPYLSCSLYLFYFSYIYFTLSMTGYDLTEAFPFVMITASYMPVIGQAPHKQPELLTMT